MSTPQISLTGMRLLYLPMVLGDTFFPSILITFQLSLVAAIASAALWYICCEIASCIFIGQFEWCWRLIGCVTEYYEHRYCNHLDVTLQVNYEPAHRSSIIHIDQSDIRASFKLTNQIALDIRKHIVMIWPCNFNLYLWISTTFVILT